MNEMRGKEKSTIPTTNHEAFQFNTRRRVCLSKNNIEGENQSQIPENTKLIEQCNYTQFQLNNVVWHLRMLTINAINEKNQEKILFESLVYFIYLEELCSEE